MSEQAYTDSETRGRADSPASSRSRSPRPRSRSPARPSAAPDADENCGNPGNNLFVNGLSTKTEAADLDDLFGKYGKVEKAQVMYDPHTRESRGFAFVTMVRGEDADAAMQVLSGFELHGSTITVSMARRGRARTPTPGTYHGPPKRERMDRRGGDRFDPRFDPRGPPRGYRDLPVRDPRPSPYERYEKYDRYDKYYGYGRYERNNRADPNERSRYEERPVARNYRVNYGAERPEFEERPMYDRSYERRPSSRYEERYDRY